MTGRYFRFGQSIWRRGPTLGLAGNFSSEDEFKLMVPKLAALSRSPPDRIMEVLGIFRVEFLGDEQAPVAYFGPKYDGRTVPNGRRMPLFGAAWWSVESRARGWSLRANNAAGSFNNAFSCTVVQADRPQIGRFLEALRIQKNTKCVATKTVAAQRPIADRELAELCAGYRKNVEKRKNDTGAMLATIVALR